MKSFQVFRKLKMKVVTSTGVNNGMITRKNSWNGPQPSIVAASSSSRGIDWMKP